jgi:hypothetical protein
MGHCIKGIGDEIEKERLKIGGIPQDEGKIRGKRGEEFDIPGVEPGFAQMDQFFENLIHIQGLQWRFGLFGKREEVSNGIG